MWGQKSRQYCRLASRGLSIWIRTRALATPLAFPRLNQMLSWRNKSKKRQIFDGGNFTADESAFRPWLWLLADAMTSGRRQPQAQEQQLVGIKIKAAPSQLMQGQDVDALASPLGHGPRPPGKQVATYMRFIFDWYLRNCQPRWLIEGLLLLLFLPAPNSYCYFSVLTKIRLVGCDFFESSFLILAAESVLNNA